MFLNIKMLKNKYTLIVIIMMFFSLFSLNNINTREIPGSAYDFTFVDIDGKNLPLSQFKGKPLLIFNSASKCGFTSQYTGIQKIHKTYKNKGLIVIGVPSDNFNQEPGNEEDIKKFCMVNFNITFDLTKKNNVVGPGVHPFFEWIDKNYNVKPKWNFYKFVINKNGKLENHFSSMIIPSSKALIATLDKVIQ
jgi:glutathione peroxidase